MSGSGAALHDFASRGKTRHRNATQGINELTLESIARQDAACLDDARRSLAKRGSTLRGATRLSKEIMNENDEMMQLFPAWREAAKIFLEEEFSADDIIEHAWFFENLGLEQPTEIMPKYQFDTIQLAYMANMEQLKEFLLQEKKICLVSV